MADDVKISVGLVLDQLNEGVKNAKDSLETLKKGFESLASVVGISLTVEGIKSFVESMAQLGSQAETIEAQLGITSTQFVQLSGLARLSGIEVGTLALGMERMTLNIQRSTRDGVNPAAQALKQLGLNAKEFTTLDASAQFERLTQAVSRFNPSMNLTNALMLVGGRSSAQLVALLRSAGLGWDEFNARVKAASVGLAEAIPGMAETHASLAILETATQSLGARIFDRLQPAIVRSIELFTKWIESISASKIDAAVTKAVDALASLLDVLQKIGEYLPKISWEGTKTDIENLAKAAENAKIGFDQLIDSFKRWGEIAGASLLTGESGIEQTESLGNASEKTSATITSGAQQTAEAYLSAVPPTQTWGNSLRELFGIAQKGPAALGPLAPFVQSIAAQVIAANDATSAFLRTLSGFGKDFGATNFDAAKQQSEAIKKIDDAYKTVEQSAKAAVDSFRITETQKTEFLKGQLEIRTALEITAGKDAGVAHAEEAKEVARLEAEETKKITDSWKSMADSIASGFSTALDSVLTKQETFGQAMTKMFAKMVEEMIANLIKLMVEYTLLSAVAGTALAPKMQAPNFGALAGGISPVLGAVFGGGGNTAQTAATTANTGALTTMSTALGLNTAVTTTGTAATATDTVATTGHTAATVGQTVATSGQTVATGVQTAVTTTQTTTGLLPMIGAFVANTAAIIPNTLAIIANTVKSVFFPLAGGAWDVGKTYGFPSYASGTAGVPGTQLALLHAGEMVIPAGPASQIRAGGAVGGASFGGTTTTNNVTGGNVSLNISAIDSRSIANMFLNNKNVMQQVLTQIARVNPGAFTRFGTNGSF